MVNTISGTQPSPSRNAWLVVGFGFFAALVVAACVWVRPGPAPRYEQRGPATSETTGKFFMGREIAQAVGHAAAPWMERPTREAAERPTALVGALGLRPGLRVADIGAGSGYVTRLLSDACATCRIFAEDIDREAVEALRTEALAAGRHNVVAVLGSLGDPGLARDSLDLALLVDVYHELSFPAELLEALTRELRSGGRLAVVEYRGEDATSDIKPLHRMTLAQLELELRANGFRFVKSIESLPAQHLALFDNAR